MCTYICTCKYTYTYVHIHVHVHTHVHNVQGYQSCVHNIHTCTCIETLKQHVLLHLHVQLYMRIIIQQYLLDQGLPY